MESPQTFTELLEQGGPVLVFMGASSVVVLALATERLLATARAGSVAERADKAVVEPLRRGDVEEARRVADTLPSPYREIFTSGLDRAMGRVRGEPAVAMHRELRRMMGVLRARVWMLGTAGALMPFAGLLGTVIGVMASFSAIGSSGKGGFAVVSGGISEALIATAAGLFVAIEAVLFFNVLQNLTGGVGRRYSLLVDEAIELLTARRRDDAGPTD
jgi:biopolymer transport protein ExbB/TolQ